MLKVLIVVTGFIEWLLKMTVFLRFPSKVLGIVVGILEYYVYIFVVLYVLSIPMFNLTFVNDSKFANVILDDTPILSDMVDDTVDVYVDVWEIIKDKNNNVNKTNTLVLATMLDNKLITVESAKKLVETNKVIVDDPGFLDNYEMDGDLYDKLKEVYYGN